MFEADDRTRADELLVERIQAHDLDLEEGQPGVPPVCALTYLELEDDLVPFDDRETLIIAVVFVVVGEDNAEAEDFALAGDRPEWWVGTQT